MIDSNKVTVGTVSGFAHYGASDIICIRSKSHYFEVPFVDSYFNLATHTDQLEMIVPSSHIECFGEQV